MTEHFWFISKVLCVRNLYLLNILSAPGMVKRQQFAAKLKIKTSRSFDFSHPCFLVRELRIAQEQFGAHIFTRQ